MRQRDLPSFPMSFCVPSRPASSSSNHKNIFSNRSSHGSSYGKQGNTHIIEEQTAGRLETYLHREGPGAVGKRHRVCAGGLPDRHRVELSLSDHNGASRGRDRVHAKHAFLAPRGKRHLPRGKETQAVNNLPCRNCESLFKYARGERSHLGRLQRDRPCLQTAGTQSKGCTREQRRRCWYIIQRAPTSNALTRICRSRRQAVILIYSLNRR